ncbi:hypothetical protein ACWEBX_26285 [Streptomyces sp. NPDC005070]
MFRRTVFGLPTASLIILGLSAGPALAEPPAPPSTATARSELSALTVAAPHSIDGYARDKFDIWSTQPDGCTTRQDVLARDGKNVQDQPNSCQPAGGSWYSASPVAWKLCLWLSTAGCQHRRASWATQEPRECRMDSSSRRSSTSLDAMEML